ncbi:unnamed protein product [Rhizoctonia solani]|uniref:ADP-ribosylation factor-like protein 2 n=1 Tax=Rhizoctonia solani TaxID=456999 RepID=A0A8H3AYN9_9AGAM|nr:unnamed protein product [Rhizoctonia solani]
MFSLSQSSASTSTSFASTSDLQTTSPGTSGSHSHDETDLDELSEPPRKRARKTTGRNHSKRMRGFLAEIVNVPMDIFAQLDIFGEWQSKTCRTSYLAQAPSLSHNMLHYYSESGVRCVGELQTCRERSIVGLSFIPEKVQPYVRLSWVIKSSAQSSPCYGLMDDVNSVVSAMFKLAVEGDATKAEEWQEARLKQIDKEKRFGLKLVGYLNRVEAEKDEKIEQLKRERFAAVKARLVENGWEEVDCDVDFNEEDRHGVLQREWDRLVFQPKPLTSRAWENIKPKILSIAKAYRAYRLEVERNCRALERQIKLGELVTAIGDEEPQIIQLALEHDQSSSQPESLTIPFPKWTHALKLRTLRQLAGEDISSSLAEDRFHAQREAIVQDLNNWQKLIAMELVEKLKPRDVLGFSDLLVCRMPWRPDRRSPAGPVELSTSFTAESNQYILDGDVRTLLRADSVFEFYDYPTCYYFPEIVEVVQEELLPPPSYIHPRPYDEDRGEAYGINPLNLRGVHAHRLGRKAAKRLLACLGKPDAAYLEMNGYGKRFVCGRCWVKTPMTWVEMVGHLHIHGSATHLHPNVQVAHYSRYTTYNWNFRIIYSLQTTGIVCREEHGELDEHKLRTQTAGASVNGESEASVDSAALGRPLVKLLTVEELDARENEAVLAQFACGVCEQVADLHNGQGPDGKPIPRPQGSREVMIEHLVDVGLDNAGKTTILKRLKGQDVMSTSPTLGFEISTITYGKYLLNIWDVGGQRTLRPYWRNYFEQTDVLVWVVDSGDRLRMEDCREELHTLLQEQRLAGSSLLVFANKQDIMGSMSDAEIKEALDLPSIRSHRWKIQPCSAVTGENVQAGLEWAVSDVAQRVYWGVIEADTPNAIVPPKPEKALLT